MTNFIKNFWKDEEGATAIEYGLIAGLIAVAIIAGASAIASVVLMTSLLLLLLINLWQARYLRRIHGR